MENLWGAARLGIWIGCPSPSNKNWKRMRDKVLGCISIETEMKHAFNRKPTFISTAWGISQPAACSPPALVHAGPMPMQLDSQYRSMFQEECNWYIRGALCFTCKEYRYVSRECPKKRTRIMGVEMDLEQELLPGNDDVQEWLWSPLWQPPSSTKSKPNWNM